MRNYQKLRVWQKGIDISIKCYQLVRGLSPNDRFEIGSQILRSAVSIPSNIAEGASRKTQKESLRYLDIAQGSVFELNTQLLIAEKSILPKNQLISEILADLDEEGKMLTTYQTNFIGNP